MTLIAPGTVLIGTYEISEHLSTGGMGEVYRGFNIHNHEVVAIKVVLQSRAADQTILSLFQKESTVLRRLAHPAIVRYEVFTIDPGIGRPCLVMEFVDGPSLADRLDEGRMAEGDVLVLLRRLASGLEAAHGAGVVHRDLSPDNVILCDGVVAEAKIIDFGIAKATTPGSGTLIGNMFAGKPGYVAPEQLGLFGGDVGPQADVYSLGLLAAAAAIGVPVDMGDNVAAAVQARLAVPNLTGLPDRLRPVIEAMLQPDPAQRPQGMAGVLEMVEQLSPQPRQSTQGPRRFTVQPTMIAPSAAAASQPPQSVPPVSQPPVSQPPVSQAPVSQAPVSQPPVSQPPVSQPPVSQPPAAPAGSMPPGRGFDAGPTMFVPQPSAPPPAVSAPPAPMPPESVAAAPMPGAAPAVSAPPAPMPPVSQPPAAQASLPPMAPPVVDTDAEGSPFGAPPAKPAPVVEPVRAPEARSKGPMLAVVVVALLAAAGGGAWVSGVFDGGAPQPAAPANAGATQVAADQPRPPEATPPEPAPPEPAPPEPAPPEPQAPPAPTLADRLAWFAAERAAAGSCAALMLAGDPPSDGALPLALFTTDAASGPALSARHAEALGEPASLAVHTVDAAQCPMLDLVALHAGGAAAEPVLALARDGGDLVLQGAGTDAVTLLTVSASGAVRSFSRQMQAGQGRIPMPDPGAEPGAVVLALASPAAVQFVAALPDGAPVPPAMLGDFWRLVGAGLAPHAGRVRAALMPLTPP